MPAPRIVLATVNARYSHTAFGLRWVWANLGAFRDAACIREFTLDQRPTDIVEAILLEAPDLVGLSVYVWNVAALTEVARLLKAVRSSVLLVAGGPEISHEYAGIPLFETVDYIVRGEGEQAFAELAEAVSAGRPPAEKVIGPVPVDLEALALPYDAYTAHDLRHRQIYVETSRGCPCHCAYCLSANDAGVRYFPLPPFFEAMEALIGRGARRIRFVDRSFNVRAERARDVLGFFQEHWCEGMQLHLEILPDRLTPDLLEYMADFPQDGLHLEVGIQSFNPEVLKRVGRAQNVARLEENLQWLLAHTGAVLHADLIVGLPGEDTASIAAGFDRLLTIAPHEIQVGVLKLLKGTPLAGQANEFGLVFSEVPPCEIVQSPELSFEQLQRLKRFARYFDLYYNSHNFEKSLRLLWHAFPSPFEAFMGLTDSLWCATGKTHQLSLATLSEQLYAFLVREGHVDAEHAAQTIRADYERKRGRSDRLVLVPE